MRWMNPEAIWPSILAFISEKRLGLGLGIIGVVICLRLLGFLEILELLTLDRLQHISPAEATDPKIVLVGIDEAYIEKEEDTALEYRDLTDLIESVLAAEPTVVGIDVVEDDLVGEGKSALISLLESNEKLIAVDKILPPTIPPFKELSDTVLGSRVGFNDLSLDDDFQIRRMFLGWSPEQTIQSFRESFALILARNYILNRLHIELTNGRKDPYAMRFGNVEIPRLQPSSGGYSQEEFIYGIQTAINFRGGRLSIKESPKPFKVLNASDIDAGNLNPKEIEQKIVIFGILAPSITDEFDSVLPKNLNYTESRRITGLEIQAHAVSQIVSAVADGRALIHAWDVPLEYLFIVAFGLLGISVRRLSTSTARGLVYLCAIGLLLCALSYAGLIINGLWLPLVPAMLVLAINGVAYIAVSQSERRWKALVQERDRALAALKLERQKTIDHAFDTIHNGPLQTLANLLRLIRDNQITLPDAGHQLEKLNREIREVGNELKQDSMSDEEVSIKVGQSRLDLNMPLHELFYEIYRETLERPFPGFKGLKVQARSLDPIASENLPVEYKRKLCLFFEEMLCNVGKHAIGATKLTVTGKKIDNYYIIRVVDNGNGFSNEKQAKKGRGTKISRELESTLKGKFIRRSNYPKGIFCEFKWAIS